MILQVLNNDQRIVLICNMTHLFLIEFLLPIYFFRKSILNIILLCLEKKLTCFYFYNYLYLYSLHLFFIQL